MLQVRRPAWRLLSRNQLQDSDIALPSTDVMPAVKPTSEILVTAHRCSPPSGGPESLAEGTISDFKKTRGCTDMSPSRAGSSEKKSRRIDPLDLSKKDGPFNLDSVLLFTVIET